MAAAALLTGAVWMALALAVAAYSSADFQRYEMPKPTWFKEDTSLEATHGRSLKATPAANCIIRVIGTGKRYGLGSAYIKCTGRKPTFFAGKPWVNYAQRNPKQFINVKLQLPNEPNFLGPGNVEPCLFLVGAGPLKLNGYARRLSLVDWAAIVIEQGTTATFNGFNFDNNVGVRFPTLAVSRSKVSVTNSKWTGNVCTDKNRCHTGGIYVTEEATLIMTRSSFVSNRGHLAGAMMVTAGAAANVQQCTFQSNSVINYGDFGGAIFHDYCRTNRVSTFSENRFINNVSQGFGGAIKVGSPDGGCKPKIQLNTFQGNRAKLTGGAVFFTYCNKATPFLSTNKFIGNKASTFNGQIGYNPLTKPKEQGGGSTGRAGCGKPTNFKNTFSGSGTVPYSKAWYFP